ncbi:hypothetical protein [uncultured Desulfobulbus sp.]|uniref:hypothetical protein n=1 Tax=uncultured Desulfobulbus sp. TaxID=239745 RepID=UPI0029C72A75|nr:hypothetical protein [uncultured Desulfobulbus sp.]
MTNQVDLKALWEKVEDNVKQKVIHPTLWRTLELAVPVIIEDSFFVVGFTPTNFNMSGHLTVPEHRNAIESALEAYSGTRLFLRVIEGQTVADWKNVKIKEADAERLADAKQKKREKESAITKTWEGLYEQVGRGYANLPLRQLPQARARFIESVIEDISDAMDDLIPEGGQVDELTERSLARVIDRAGSLTDVPPAMIALELKRFRERK